MNNYIKSYFLLMVNMDKNNNVTQNANQQQQQKIGAPDAIDTYKVTT